MLVIHRSGAHTAIGAKPIPKTIPRRNRLTMDAYSLAVIIIASIILTIFGVIAWEMDHDTKPRDPYNRP